MKLERQDTEPLVGNQDDFSSLLLQEGSLSIPRFDTADLNALEEISRFEDTPTVNTSDIDSAINSNLQINNIQPQQQQIPMSAEVNTAYLDEMRNLVNEDLPSNAVHFSSDQNAFHLGFFDLPASDVPVSINY